MTSNNQYNLSFELVEQIGSVFGYNPGSRAIHAGARFYQGTFKATPIAQKYSMAVHLQGDEIPVTVRFSKGGTNPDADFAVTLGMATRFYLPKGNVVNIVMLNMKHFFANSPEQLMALLESAKPLEPNGPPNLEGLKGFLSVTPNVAYAIKLIKERLAPVSFANTEFNSTHAFFYRNEAGEVTAARSRWVPVAGIIGQPVDELAAGTSETIFYEELEERLSREKVEFDLVLEIAGEGDSLVDPTAPWGPNRETVSIGRMTLTAPAYEEDFVDKVMNHDPTQLTEGIELTDDPILHARRGVYEASVARRTGGWKGNSGGCPFGYGDKS